MEASARGAAEQTPGGQQNRMVAGGDRFHLHTRDAAGKKTGPSPVDRRKYGSKHHLLVDGKGRVPLAFSVTPANRHDVTQLLPLVEGVPMVKGKIGQPRHRPGILLGDRRYDSDPHRQALRERGIRPPIARRRTANGSGLGIYRWVVERAESWVHKYRRLKLRYERRDDIHEAFVALACALICHNCLLDPFC
jgi:transposase